MVSRFAIRVSRFPIEPYLFNHHFLRDHVIIHFQLQKINSNTQMVAIEIHPLEKGMYLVRLFKSVAFFYHALVYAKQENHFENPFSAFVNRASRYLFSPAY